MNNSQTPLESTNFGTIAARLRDQSSPIYFVLHVKDPAMIAPLAEDLAKAAQQPAGFVGPEALLVNQLRKEGALQLSARHPQWLADPGSCLDVSTIPASASCQAMYAPPFYLVHTPGLFEGTLAQSPVATVQPVASQKQHGRRIEI
jgi:hypothetical protein